MSIRQLLANERDGEEWRKRARNTVNQLVRRVGGDGSSADRPIEVTVGLMYFDQTLGQPIWWDGAAWVDAMGDPA